MPLLRSRTLGTLAALVCLTSFFSPTVAHAQAQVSVTPVATVTGAEAVHIPVSLGGFEAASELVAIVRVPDAGGSLTLLDGDQGGALTLLYGYAGFDHRLTIGFQGSRDAVTAALATKLYWNAPQHADPVQLEIVVAEYQAGTFFNPGNGHYYLPVAETPVFTWTQAKEGAAIQALFGVAGNGYLATVTSRRENDFVSYYTTLDDLWIGATDDVTEVSQACPEASPREGEWYWVTGPEACTFFYDQGTGSPVNGEFSAWEDGEPNNNDNEEHYAATNYRGAKGRWNDFSISTSGAFNYLVEFDGETSGALQASTVGELEASAPILVGTLAGDGSVTPAAIEAVAGGAAVPVAIELKRYDSTAGDLVAIVSVPDSGGTLTLDNSGLALTLEFGYADFVEETVIGFHGSFADVELALRERITWLPPAESGDFALNVSAGRYVSGHFFNQANNHYYRSVTSGSDIGWPDARNAAASATLAGMSGYLATITSVSENDFIKGYVNAQDVWIGASDWYSEINAALGMNRYPDAAAAEGHWYWVTGPEAGTQICAGNNPCSAVNGEYVSWAAGEPNNAGDHEDAAVTNWSGTLGAWNDLHGTAGGVRSYLIEFGGMPGEVSTLQKGSGTGALTVIDVPGVPGTPGATASYRQVALTWTAPASNGGRAITDYAVTVTPATGVSGATTRLVGSATESYVFEGLANDTTYSFTVAAINEVGTGQGSAPVSATPRLDQSDGADLDGDGIPDRADVDVDGDGTPDNGTDWNGDGINDAGDRDSDGIVDSLEAGATATAYADMRTWILEGVSGGNWVDPEHITQPFVDATSGRSVFQTVNNTAGTMFLVSNDDNVINRAVWGTIEIKSRHTDSEGNCSPGCSSSETDNDWVGFVMGYRNEDSNAYPEEYVGFTWNRDAGATSPYRLPSSGSQEGLYLVKATPPDAAGNPIGGGATIIDSRTGAGTGWRYDTEYRFRILYTTNLIRVYINDVLMLEATAAEAGVESFIGGQFGFSNASQANDLFGNVREANASAMDSEPVAVDDRFYYGLTWGAAYDNTNIFDTAVDPLASGILDNDYDPDGDTFRIDIGGTTLETSSDSVVAVGTAGGQFTIFGDGRLVYEAPADYMTRGPFQDQLPYTIVDEDGEHSATITLTVQEVNTAPDDIRLADADTGSVTDVRVREGAAPGTVVGLIDTLETQPGELDAYDYELEVASGGAFKVNGDKLLVRDTEALNALDVHYITVRSTDVEGQAVSRQFPIHVDPNALPTSADGETPAETLVPLTLGAGDFPFADADGDELGGLRVVVMPVAGTLFIDHNQNNAPDGGEVLEINFNDVVSRAQLDLGRFKYLASDNDADVEDTFQFRVSDGTAYSTAASTMTVQVDADSDDDGIPNVVEGVGDSDDDGTPDYADGDADGDGIADEVEGAADTDGDGIADYLDDDSDGDGLPDAAEGAGDGDNDGLPDYQDPDRDNDGVPDGIEVDQGTNPDDAANARDSDGDGVPDYVESETDGTDPGDADDATDTDGDGVPDYVENVIDGTDPADAGDVADADGDGVPDYTEGRQGTDPADPGDSQDTDGDGVPDYVETEIQGTNPEDGSDALDSDNDGVPDYTEEQQGTEPNDAGDFVDSDGDGVPDYVEARDGTNPDDDSSFADNDGDGTPDYIDPDDDNDGVADTIEESEGTDPRDPASRPADADQDGLPDVLDDDDVNADTDGDGIPDGADVDVDGDGIPEPGAVDSDGDGIRDAVDADEFPLESDTDGDGIIDSADPVDNTADADGDGLPDALDPDDLNPDTDGDGVPDGSDVDVNGDGVADNGTDSDGDGINDLGEGAGDSDGDGIPDYLDTDSDNDGIDDADEGAVDTDRDGTPDYLDTSIDEDNDGIPDILEGVNDADGDGLADFLDTDSDGDGVPDRLELAGLNADADADGVPDRFDVDVTGGSDANGDGIDDAELPDTDNDGLSDAVDPDQDNDGIPDIVESGALGVDSDGDGIDDAWDADQPGQTDANGDGIADEAELRDSDSDGEADVRDSDSDNDGIDDAEEGAADADGDGLPDYRDTDSDGDGVEDAIETVGDADADGIPNYLDTDADGDGIADTVEGDGDSDGDGIADYLDTDSDNDGIPDAAERNGDSDGDGIADRLDTDSDNDGIDDAAEGAGDTDGDGTPDYLDTSIDEDGDRIPDIVEGILDLDGDGLPAFQDIDSDGDGVPDRLEIAGLGDDSDEDGIPNRFDVDQTGGPDANGDGIDDDASIADTDGDGLNDLVDPDQDNDGLPDAIEAGAYGFDSDGDGIDDRWDAATAGNRDADGDGIADDARLPDTDSDGTPDVRDLDSDRDGVSDANEGGALGSDSDGDGIDDAFDVDRVGGTDEDGNGVADGITARDTDDDGVPDYLDLDSDNDSLSDVAETGGLDDDEDGLLDAGGLITSLPVDSDGDGLPDLRDPASRDGVLDISATGFAALDRNGDGVIDELGDDLDGDGIADAIDGEPGQRGTRIDNDKDGVPVNRDADDDNDGVADAVEGTADTDGDGAIDRIDRDADNDGIPDRIEAGLPQPSGLDADLDGIDDAWDVSATGGRDDDGDGIDDRFSDRDSDGDGIPDRLDEDSDNDGLSDAYEALLVSLSGSDTDGDGLDDAIDVDATGGTDANRDGVDDAVLDLRDTDGDGLEDFRDPDSDNDGIGDGEEDGDFNGDGVNDRLQVDPGVDTGLEGGGSFGWPGLALLAVLAAARRRQWLGLELPFLRLLSKMPVFAPGMMRVNA